MTKRLSLERFPLHLGLGGTAVPQPEISGMDWFAAYDTADVAGHATALFITAGV